MAIWSPVYKTIGSTSFLWQCGHLFTKQLVQQVSYGNVVTCLQNNWFNKFLMVQQVSYGNVVTCLQNNWFNKFLMAMWSPVHKTIGSTSFLWQCGHLFTKQLVQQVSYGNVVTCLHNVLLRVVYLYMYRLNPIKLLPLYTNTRSINNIWDWTISPLKQW